MTEPRWQSEDGIRVRSAAVGFSPGYALPAHAHDWDQLIYACDGVMSVHTRQGTWVVPSQRAVWVPAGVEHEEEMSVAVSMRTLYLRPGLAAALLPGDCCVVSVAALLRELMDG